MTDEPCGEERSARLRSDPRAHMRALGSEFSVEEARRAGWSLSRIARAPLDRPFHGVRAAAAFDPESLEMRAAHLRLVRSFATRMTPHEFVVGTSAAVMWGLPLPPWAVSDEVDVGVHKPHRSPRARGVRGRSVLPELADIVQHPQLGIMLTSPASTWAMLAATLRHPYDLIAVADAVIREPQHPDDPAALASFAQLDAAVRAGRRIGVDALRRALPRVRVGSSSRPETWTRLLLVDAGLSEPELAYEVFDEDGFIGRLDMAYPRRRVAVEYEGEQHLTDPGQWSRDIARYERLAAAGWTVIRVEKRGLFTRPHSVVARVRAALSRD